MYVFKQVMAFGTVYPISRVSIIAVVVLFCRTVTSMTCAPNNHVKMREHV